MNRIAFDLDQVVINTYNIIADGLYKHFGLYFPEEEHHEFNFDIPNVDWIVIDKVITDILMQENDNALPLNNSIQYLKEIYAITKRSLIFITSRSDVTWNVTNKWIWKYLDEPYKLLFTNHKSKVEYLIENRIDYFVDDRYKTAIECSPYLKKMFLYDQTWNRNRPVPKNVIRIKNLQDILKYFT